MGQASTVRARTANQNLLLQSKTSDPMSVRGNGSIRTLIRLANSRIETFKDGTAE